MDAMLTLPARPRRRTGLVVAGALLALTACQGDGGSTADDPATSASAPETPETQETPETPESQETTPGSEAEPGSYPPFPDADYTYTLEVVCFCPLAVPAEVTVEDGEVTSAVALRSAPRIRKGEEVPEFQRRSIDDIVAAANEPGVDEVEVTWPAGQDWPDRVRLDPIAQARDDEVTYLLSDVEVR
jgi:hypothetical protein